MPRKSYFLRPTLGVGLGSTMLGDRPKRRALTTADKAAIRNKCGGRCGLCGKKITDPDDMDYGHIRAFSKGGRTIPRNMVLLHVSCNRKQGRMNLSQAKKKLGYAHPSKVRKRRHQASTGKAFDFNPRGYKSVIGGRPFKF